MKKSRFTEEQIIGFLHPNGKRPIALLPVVLKFAPGRALAWAKERAPILYSCGRAVIAIRPSPCR